MTDFSQKKSTYLDLKVTQLHSNLTCQRELRTARVKQLVDNWDDGLAGTITVNCRNGEFRTIDGQNRVVSCGIKFKDDKNKTLYCKVFFELTDEEEKELFARIADGTVTVELPVKFINYYNSNEPRTVKFVNTIKESGLYIDVSSVKAMKTAGKNKITCIKPISKIYNKMIKDLSTEDFIRYLKLIKDTWDGNEKSLTSKMLTIIYNFYILHKDKLNDATFVKQLKQVTPTQIISIGDGRTYANKSDNYNSVLVQYYNYNLKGKSSRLSHKLMEDIKA